MFTYSLDVKINHGLFFRLYIFQSESLILVSVPLFKDNFRKFSMASSDDFFFLIFLCIYDVWNALRLGLRVEVLGCAGLKLFFQIGIVFPFVMFLEYNHLGLELF